MTSERQIAANRRNGRRSNGPRTAAGKASSRSNGLRHGLAAIICRRSLPSGEVERLARAVCGQGDDPPLFAAAIAIAESYLLRRAIQEQRIAVIERLRDRTAIALKKGDNSLTLGKAKFMAVWLANREIETLVPKALEKYFNERPQIGQPPDPFGLVPIRLKALLEESECAETQHKALELATQHFKAQERNECEALEEAIPDLICLERYDRRAWSQQKRAVREFINIRVTRDLGMQHQPGDRTRG